MWFQLLDSLATPTRTQKIKDSTRPKDSTLPKDITQPNESTLPKDLSVINDYEWHKVRTPLKYTAVLARFITSF